jgi:hypothetical protein
MSIAASFLKKGDRALSEGDHLSQNLCNAFADKGIPPEMLKMWVAKPGGLHLLSHLVGQFLMRLPYDAS